MPEITVHVPDFATMEDDDVRQHPLARFRDGRWSALSNYLKQHFETDRMNLNEDFVVLGRRFFDLFELQLIR